MNARDFDDENENDDLDDEVPVILCLCGQTLRLPGARPGRIGHCPACGEEFRVPEMGRRVPQRPLRDEDDAAVGGYDLAPESESTSTTGPRLLRPPREQEEPSEERARPKKKTSAERTPIEAVGRGGLFPLPRRPEETLLGSLRYPLWDGMGLMAMLLLPIGLSFTSILIFGVLPWALKTGGIVALVVPIIIGFIVIFAFLFAFALAAGSEVLVASAMGEIHHPRWPDLEIGVLFGTALRWGLAWGVGLGLVYLPLNWLLPFQGEIDLFGRLLRGILLSIGGLYALVALLSIYLHDDLGAINPFRVLPALPRFGSRLLGIWAMLAGTIALGVVAVSVVHRAAGFGIPILLTAAWLAWVFAIYAGLVILRALGRTYDLQSEAVGWFEKHRSRDEDDAKIPPVPPEIPDI